MIKKVYTYAPGPWEYDGLDITGDVGEEICKIGTQLEEPVNECNAALICAAPELFELLESFPGFENSQPAKDVWSEKLYDLMQRLVGE